MTLSNIELLVSEGLQRISEAARFLGVSRSLVYKLIRAGQLPTVKLGKSRRVPVRAVRALATTNLVEATASALDEPPPQGGGAAS
jgi:excisionase family DNA binding protein